MDEQAVLRLARRRRLGRRLELAVVPVGLLVWFVTASWGEGVPDAVSLMLLVVLGGAVAVGWWWLERSAGRSTAEFCRAPGDPALAGRTSDEELDDARAELALRTCSPPPPGGRVRVEGLVARRARDARFRLWAAPAYAVVVGLLAVDDGLGGDDAMPWVLVVLWLVLAVAGLGQGIRDRRRTRRWMTAHGSVEVAGHH